MIVIELFENGLIVKDIYPWEISVKKGLTSKPWSVYFTPSGYDNDTECQTRYGLESENKGEQHLVDVRTISV